MEMLRTEGTYYARSEHGGHRVVADSNGFRVSWPSGDVRYPSARQTIIALTNRSPSPQPHHRDPKITFNRYFRQGRYSKPQPPVDVWSMFTSDLTVEDVPLQIKSSPSLSIEKVVKGIDLAKRGHEVRKLFYAGFGRRVVKYGYDPDDVLQEVYQGLLVRNNGKCPFDPSKSSFGHYVHMVCGCIVSNYRRRYSRLSRNEQFGVLGAEGEVVDVREADLASCDENQSETVMEKQLRNELLDMVEDHFEGVGEDVALGMECFSLMSQGYRKREIAERVGTEPSKATKILKLVRQAVTARLR